jgi:GT2 family glycosyltransferase
LACLRSIEKEAANLNFEILLIDNGSTDGSVEALRVLHKKDFWKKRLTLIFNKSNSGYSKANNQGIKKAKGEYILLLNNDTIVHKNSLQNLLEFGKKTKDAGVVGSKLLNIDGTVQESVFNFPTLTNAVKEYFFGNKNSFSKYAPSSNVPVVVDIVVGAVFLITPKALKKVGILDEKYFAYFEDTDYCRRVWKSGLKVYYNPQSIITHYHGATFNKLPQNEEAIKWRRLIPSSIIYHGTIKHYLLTLVLKVGQSWRKIVGNQ